MDAPGWFDELDLHAGPPEAAMGTRALDEDRWLLVDDEWAAQRDAARGLLRDRPRDVLAGDVSMPVARALDSEVRAWLERRGLEELTPHGGTYGYGGTSGRMSLAVTRFHIAEDLCILTPSDGAWILSAGAVCFPSYWRLTDKIGRPLDDVHEPVPGYPGALATRVDSFLDRLRPGRGVWRRNWSIHATDALFVPEHPHDAGALPPPPSRWLRSEYQTLRRLHGVDAVVFTIRTQQVPLAALESRSDHRAAIVAAVRAWTPHQRAYKGGAVDDALLDWLDRA